MANEALSTGKAATKEMLGWLVSYILPIAGVMVGALTGVATWGGVNAMYGLLTKATIQSTSKSSTVSWMAAAAVFGGSFAGLGGAFWHLSRGDGLIRKGVCRVLAGYFFGTALSYLFGVMASYSVGDGLIDDIVGGITNFAAEV